MYILTIHVVIQWNFRVGSLGKDSPEGKIFKDEKQLEAAGDRRA